MRVWPGDTGQAKIQSANASRDKTQGVIMTIGSRWLVSSAICTVVDWRRSKPHTSLSHTDKHSMVIELELWSSELKLIRAPLQLYFEPLFENSVTQPSCQTFPRWKTSLQTSYRHAASRPRFWVCFRELQSRLQRWGFSA